MKLRTRRPVARSTIAMKVGAIACWKASRVAFTASCCDAPISVRSAAVSSTSITISTVSPLRWTAMSLAPVP